MECWFGRGFPFQKKHHALLVQNHVYVSSLAPGGGEVCCRMRRRWGAAVLTTSTLLGRLADSKRRASATSTPHADELQAPSAVSPSFQGR